MQVVDIEFASAAMRLWIVAGTAALLVIFCAIALFRKKGIVRAAAVCIAAALSAVLTWTLAAGTSTREQAAERRALELRAQELTVRALAPGSSLACLDAAMGDDFEAACERAVFAAPATLAAAISLVAARLDLVADMTAYGLGAGGADIEHTLLPLRRSLEADRFGLLAHALASRNGCTVEKCQALDVLAEPGRVRANLGDDAFARRLGRYMMVWAAAAEAPVALTAQAPPSLASPLPPGQRKVSVNIDFPSAASIPAVSIMNAEPKTPPTPSASAAVNANSPSTTALRRPRKQSSSSIEPEPVEPVWMPAPAPAPQPAASAANASTAGAPVQLNPFPAAPEANTGTATRNP